MKHMRRPINDRPVHYLFGGMFIMLLALLVYAFMLYAVQADLDTSVALIGQEPEPTRSSCWHPPYLLDQPSELACSLRVPTKS